MVLCAAPQNVPFSVHHHAHCANTQNLSKAPQFAAVSESQADTWLWIEQRRAAVPAAVCSCVLVLRFVACFYMGQRVMPLFNFLLLIVLYIVAK